MLCFSHYAVIDEVEVFRGTRKECEDYCQENDIPFSYIVHVHCES